MRITKKWLETHDWMLRSSDNGVSHNGFKWPAVGKWVTCPDWDPKPECGHGFHGLTPEHNRAGLFYGRVELCETRGERVVIDDDKIKVPEARIVAIGKDIPIAVLESCGFRVAAEGQIITTRGWIALGVAVTVNDGGACSAHYGSTVTVNDRGWCWAYDGSTVTVNDRGWCYAYNGSTVVRRKA